MSALAGHVADYLRLRRALGFKLRQPGRELPQFVTWLQEQTGAETITAAAAIRWARLHEGAAPITMAHRLGAVRGFARYLATIDPATEIPPLGLFGKQQRKAPYIYSADQIARLLHAAGQLPHPLLAATYEALFGLLAATGMRVSEALRLARDDADLSGGVLRIQHAKFDRDRFVPLHPEVTAALRGYAARRDRACPRPKSETFFLGSLGASLPYKRVNETFHALLPLAGIPTTADHQPRIHDLRHRFVVHTLTDWQAQGVDIASRLPVLSTYLGHVSPASTYWYYSATPELMHLAATRLHDPAGASPGARP